VSVSETINTSPINKYVINIILRDNEGYDFMSWQKGIQSISNIEKYDEVIFCNDSCYGPIYPLEHIFSQMNKKNADVWGITDSNQISYHIQSYFMVFKKNVFLSESFKSFINSIAIEKSKEDIVRKYEVGLSDMLLENGYSLDSFIKFRHVLGNMDSNKIYKDKFYRIVKLLSDAIRNESGYINKISRVTNVIKQYVSRVKDFSVKDNSNIKFVAWRELIELGDPFIKVMLIRDNPSNIGDIEDYSGVVKNSSGYDVSLITNHLNRVNKNV
jgi:rhamnosyltransferase